MLETSVGHFDGPAGSEHVCLVQRLTGWVVLLPVAISRVRVGRHDDPRPRAVHARPPRVARLDEASMLALEGVLAEIPDVPVLVLRVEVERALDRAAVFGDRIPDDGAADAEDPLLLM